MVNFHLPLCHCHQRHQVHMEMRHAGCKTCTSRLPASLPAQKCTTCAKFQLTNVNVPMREGQPLSVTPTHPPTHPLNCTALRCAGRWVGGCQVEWMGV